MARLDVRSGVVVALCDGGGRLVVRSFGLYRRRLDEALLAVRRWLASVSQRTMELSSSRAIFSWRKRE